MVQYYEVIDGETGLTVEKYNTAAEAQAVADILNRQTGDSTEAMVEPVQDVYVFGETSTETHVEPNGSDQPE
tara:strand:+ start:733 stop:948 length:216 start_codon:yes stop_codon:yes gene_type:complete